MIWIAIIGAFLLIIGILVRDGNIDPTTFWKPLGSFLAGLGWALFAFLLIVSLVGGIEQLGK